MAILIFLGAFALAYFVLWGQVSQMFADYQALQMTRQERDDLMWLIANKDDLAKRLAAYHSDHPVLFQAFSETFNESNPIMAMYTIAKNAGLEMTQIDVQKPDVKGTVIIKTSVIGSIAALHSMLLSLGTSLPLIDFISTPLDANSPQSQNFSIEARTYLLTLAQVASPITYHELRAQIASAFATNADILKDDRIKQFKAVEKLPVSSPAKSDLGGRDPFAPL